MERRRFGPTERLVPVIGQGAWHMEDDDPKTAIAALKLVSAGVHPDGSECSNCGQLWPGSLALCPSCDHPMRTVHDLFHRAIEHAHAQAAWVEVVHGAAGRHLQEACGGLGALLRYR